MLSARRAFCILAVRDTGRRSSVVEQRTRNAQVRGSNPLAGSRFFRRAKGDTITPAGFRVRVQLHLINSSGLESKPLLEVTRLGPFGIEVTRPLRRARALMSGTDLQVNRKTDGFA